MKILRLLTVLVIAALTFAACDDTTEGIGGSITNKIDNINITSAVFPVATKSMVSGAVLSRNNSGLIGKMKDPETGNYVKGDYMTQLGVLPTFSVDTLDYIKQANKGSIEADSCYLLVSYNASYGDALLRHRCKAAPACGSLGEVLVVANEDVDTLRNSSSHVPVGTELSREDMLRLALMSSENRASSSLARSYPGGYQAFVAAMNRTVRFLGARMPA